MGQQHILLDIYERLFAEFGPQGWWPAGSRFEILVGAILVQNTNWANTAKAIANLQDRGLLDFQALIDTDVAGVSEAIRPCGYYNIKAKRLNNLLTMIQEKYGGDLDLLLHDSTENARHNLLMVKGVGPETADAILLYCGNHPLFVVDAYTHRAFSRHNLVPEECDYQEMQDIFMDALPEDSALFNEYHALIVMLGKTYCKKKNPLCETCPLQGVFP